MSVPTKVWLWLCAVIITGAAVWYHGYHTADAAWQLRDTERKLSEAAIANQAWAERFTLQAQLATRDQQLADAQQAASEARTETIIKREVIYRDKSLPHARGGVSYQQAYWLAHRASSPRPWGCFLLRQRSAHDDGVFPTPVGVFLVAALG